MDEEGYLDEAQAVLALHILPENFAATLSHAFATARTLQTEEFRARALNDLILRVKPAMLSNALDVARSIEEDQYRSEVLTALVRHLPPEQQPPVFAVACRIADKEYCDLILQSISAQLLSEFLYQTIY